jgi:hypothetical protein
MDTKISKNSISNEKLLELFSGRDIANLIQLHHIIIYKNEEMVNYEICFSSTDGTAKHLMYCSEKTLTELRDTMTKALLPNAQ